MRIHLNVCFLHFYLSSLFKADVCPWSHTIVPSYTCLIQDDFTNCLTTNWSNILPIQTSIEYTKNQLFVQQKLFFHVKSTFLVTGCGEGTTQRESYSSHVTFPYITMQPFACDLYLPYTTPSPPRLSFMFVYCDWNIEVKPHNACLLYHTHGHTLYHPSS